MDDSMDEYKRRSRQEALSQIRTYKKLIHPDFAWWKEREKVSGYHLYLRNSSDGEPTAPPEEVLRTLDKFESLLAWLEAKPIGQEMTAYEKAQIVCKLLDETNDSRNISVSLESDSFDVSIKGDPSHPVHARLEGGGFNNSLRVEQVEE